MKRTTTLLILISIFSGMVLGSDRDFSNSGIPLPQDKVSGIWLGELKIPNLADLRMGIIISGDVNNSYKAVLNIIDQATGDIPCDEVIYRNDSVIVRIKGLGLEIAGSLDQNNQALRSEFRQGGGKFDVLFSRFDKLPVLLRPQEPAKPYPYLEENVVFENKKAGIKLAGTLTLPKSKGRVPAVVLVTGSGQQNRDEEIGKHKPFWIIADHLTRNGIAVLRVDDRGVGASTGNFDRATTEDFADDALAGIAFLNERKDINKKKIGILGHSEGGTVAALAASMSSDISFVAAMAGGFINFEEIVLDQIGGQLRQQGKKDEDIELERAWRTKIYALAKEKSDSADAAKKLWAVYEAMPEEEISKLNWPRERQNAQIGQVLNPWWRYLLALDNKAVLLKVECPMLALYGDLDQQVNPERNIQIIESAIKEGGKKNIEIEKLQGLNHLFQTAKTGSEYEYIRIEETISPLALSKLTDWIKKETD